MLPLKETPTYLIKEIHKNMYKVLELSGIREANSGRDCTIRLSIWWGVGGLGLHLHTGPTETNGVWCELAPEIVLS